MLFFSLKGKGNKNLINLIYMFEKPFKENKNGILGYFNIFSQCRNTPIFVTNHLSTKMNHKITISFILGFGFGADSNAMSTLKWVSFVS